MREAKYEDIGKRMSLIKSDKNLSQEMFAKNINASQSNISKMTSGLLAPNFENLKLIVEKYGVNPLWLLTGKGQMYGTMSEASIDKIQSLGSNLNDQVAATEKRHIIKNQSESIKELTQTNQKLTDGMIDLMRRLISGSKSII